MTTRCVIVEDEPLAQDRLVEYVGRVPGLELVATFDAATPALAFLQAHGADVVFLDVRLGGQSGIEMLETGGVKSRVVLTTAYADHAVKAYELGVSDYLVKPFTFERFVQAVDRVRRDLGCIFVKSGLRVEKVMLDEILAIEGQRDYRRIHTPTRRIMTLQTFTEFERLLPADRIVRVHRSFMVALDKIDRVEQGAIRVGELSIPISDTYRERFYAAVGSLKQRI